MGFEAIPNKITLEDQNGTDGNDATITNTSGVLAITGIKVGTATIAANAQTVTVTHSLGATPTTVLFAASQNLGTLTYASLGSTTFICNSSASTGTATTILWIAIKVG